MPGSKLYIVPTPIGNLKDITLRALDVLREVDTILAEDTRTTMNLLAHYNISPKKLQPYHKFNEHKTVQGLVERIRAGETMALVTDAGTPGISDPGYLLIRSCIDAGINIEVLPGATALIPALVASGFPTDRFVFEGFLPHKKGRQKKLKSLVDEERTIVLYESPYRLMKLLEEIKQYFGPERKVSVARELTKIYEEVVRGTIDEVIEYFTGKKIKGEIVVVIAPPDN